MEKLLFEMKRKLFHLISLLYIVIYIILLKIFDREVALLSLIFILGIFVIIEYHRIIKKRKVLFFHILFRKKEEDKLAGNIYFTLGAILAFAVFELDIAITALLMTTLGDLVAAIFGIAFGKHWLKKTPDTAWEGIIAEFIVDLIIGFVVLGNIWIVIPMALVATYVETKMIHIDDNLAVPIFSGFIGQVVRLMV